MTYENENHIPLVDLSEKEREEMRHNFKRFLKRHKEPKFIFSLKKG